MKPQFYFLLLFVFLQTSCRQNPDSAAVDQLKADLTSLKTELEQSTEALSNLKSAHDYSLVHLVYFDLREGADAVKFIEELRKLEGIDVLKDLQIGHFTDLKDPRALSQFELMMQMGFADQTTYQAYQSHPLHLALKESAKGYLAGPPVTYDYIKSSTDQ